VNGECVLKMTHQTAAPGAKSDVYDFLDLGLNRLSLEPLVIQLVNEDNALDTFRYLYESVGVAEARLPASVGH